MLFVILAAVMGGEARAVVVRGRAVVSERVGRAETVEKWAETLRVESERTFLGAALEVQNAAGLEGAGPLALWFPGGAAVARSDCGDRQAVFSGGTSAAEYTVTVAAGSAWTVPSAATVQHVRGPDLGGGTKGLLYSLRNGLPTFNRYNGRGDVVAQSDIDGTTTWAASYQADGRRTAEAGTNVERHRACTKEEDPTGLLNEGFRYRDMETGTFISRDPLGLVDGPNVYCYVRQNPWSAYDSEGLFLNFIAGAVIGAAIDVGAQLITEGKVTSWGSVAVSAGMGATGVGLGNVVARTAAKTAIKKGVQVAGARAAQAATRVGANAASGAVEGAGEQMIRNAMDGERGLLDGVGSSAGVGALSAVGGDAAGLLAKKITGPSARDLKDLANDTISFIPEPYRKRNKTVAAARLEGNSGGQTVVAGNDTQLSPMQRDFVEARGATPVRDAPSAKHHAEMTVLNYAEMTNQTAKKMEVTRSICTECGPRVRAEGVKVKLTNFDD